LPHPSPTLFFQYYFCYTHGENNVSQHGHCIPYGTNVIYYLDCNQLDPFFLLRRRTMTRYRVMIGDTTTIIGTSFAVVANGVRSHIHRRSLLKTCLYTRYSHGHQCEGVGGCNSRRRSCDRSAAVAPPTRYDQSCYGILVV
jgi:hypothetical protein